MKMIILGVLLCLPLAAHSTNISLRLTSLGWDSLIDPTYPARPLITAGGEPFLSTAGHLLPDGELLFEGTVQPGGPDPQWTLIQVQPNGTPDPTFNLQLMSWQFDYIVSTSVQPDGRILVAYLFGSDVHVVRFNGDGSVDQTFSPTLLTLTNLASSSPAKVVELVPELDGHILLGERLPRDRQGETFKIRRLKSNGAAEPGYHAEADLKYPFSPGLALQPDGRLLMRGTFTNVNGVVRKNLVRLNADGSIDLTFVPPPAFDAEPAAPDEFFGSLEQVLGTTHDGKILANVPNGKLLRLQPNGQIDAGFTPQYAPHNLLVELPDGSWIGDGLGDYGAAHPVIGPDGAFEWIPADPEIFSQLTALPNNFLLATLLNPKTPDSPPQLVRLRLPFPRQRSSISRATDGTLQLDFELLPIIGVRYALEASSDFRSWTMIAELDPQSPGTAVVQDSEATPLTRQRFFRLRQEDPEETGLLTSQQPLRPARE